MEVLRVALSFRTSLGKLTKRLFLFFFKIKKGNRRKEQTDMNFHKVKHLHTRDRTGWTSNIATVLRFGTINSIFACMQGRLRLLCLNCIVARIPSLFDSYFGLPEFTFAFWSRNVCRSVCACVCVVGGRQQFVGCVTISSGIEDFMLDGMYPFQLLNR